MNTQKITQNAYYKILTAKAPVNIAVIKYWGKSNVELKIPINDSLSATLNMDEMCTTTSVAISSKFEEDKFFLNGREQDLTASNKSPAKVLLDQIRGLSKLDRDVVNYKVHIVSYNNFPTAAGLASSAAGYACLAYVLGHTYGITDQTQLSILARQGSGSACRSLFGGFVRWFKGSDNDSSKAVQIVDQKHWPEMKIVICVINDNQKDVSSSGGMLRSVQNSSLIRHRAEVIVPERIDAITEAILSKDFETFARITMQDSNQFHAICLDTYPPIFYLNETSRQLIKLCTIINKIYRRNVVAYTFDAGPNACIYLLDDFVSQLINLIQEFFPIIDETGNRRPPTVQGQVTPDVPDKDRFNSLVGEIKSEGLGPRANSISYLINTSIGPGPKLVEENLTDETLRT